MGNSIKKEYDKLSITKDIVERQNIIRQLRITGFIDRNNAIKKIESIQGTDAELALATIATGDIFVGNPSACWIPELTVSEEISGTIYTVTGSYEGTESFLRKLERIAAKKFTNQLEEDG